MIKREEGKEISKEEKEKLIKKFYFEYIKLGKKTEKMIIIRKLSKLLNKSIKQVERYFKSLKNDENPRLDRGYGRKIPLENKQCRKFLDLLKNGNNNKEIQKKISLSSSKVNRLKRSLLVPINIYYYNGFICVELKDKTYLKIEYNCRYDCISRIIQENQSKIMDEIYDKISYIFEEKELKNLDRDSINSYYNEKIIKIIINYDVNNEYENIMLEDVIDELPADDDNDINIDLKSDHQFEDNLSENLLPNLGIPDYSDIEFSFSLNMNDKVITF